jgi:hypothetical protein
MKLSLDVNF